MATITAANAIFLLTIADLYPVAQRLRGFGVDDAFTTDAADMGETQVGVDGYGVGGYVPRVVPMTIRFLASSTSLDVFENWIGAMDAAQEVIYGSAVINQPSIGRKYTCYLGQLMRVNTMADVRRVLANREFHISWLPQGTIPAISAAPV
jgi:hypothetical protein